MAQAMVETGKMVRQMVINAVQALPEEIYDIQPEAFNNTIRWNIGHQIVVLDLFLSKFVSFGTKLPESYSALFGPGTKPADWTSAPPSKEELFGYLTAQLDSLAGVQAEVLNAPLPAPFQLGKMTFHLVGEVFNFAFIHESMHLSTALALKKVIKHGMAAEQV